MTQVPSLLAQLPGQAPAGAANDVAGLSPAAGQAASGGWPAAAPPSEAGSLLDLLYDGFYMLFLVRSRQWPGDASVFKQRIQEFLAEVDRGAQRLKASAEDIHLSKFAFCALVDEVVLASVPPLRDAWEQRPLQLEYFGEQLAGERFFERLDELRAQGAARVQVLEVFHMCLLLGFQGRYRFDGKEKLGYLTARVGDEITHFRGTRPGFAPNAHAPDRFVHLLKQEIPVWVVGAVFLLAGVLAFVGLRWSLVSHTEERLAGYEQVVTMPPPAAHITISLP